MFGFLVKLNGSFGWLVIKPLKGVVAVIKSAGGYVSSLRNTPSNLIHGCQLKLRRHGQVY